MISVYTDVVKAFLTPATRLRILIGAATGLFLISVFLIAAGEGKPEWGTLWRIKPLVMVPLAGAAGGAFLSFMMTLPKLSGWSKLVATIIGMLGFVIALWMGSVLGLNGTHWD
jgi:hypothetical protein